MSAASRERHARILDEGVSLVSQEGLAGVTLGGLAERVGMSKSGLFAHFRSKEEVQTELLERVEALGQRWVLEPTLAVPEGLPRLRALFDNWLGWASRAGLPGGCPIAAATFEVDDLEGALRERVAEIQRGWEACVTGIVARAIELGHLRPDADPEQIVWEMGAIYLGHHTAQRFTRDPLADRRARVAFEALLARFLPETAP